MGDVAYQVVDGIAVLPIDNPPVNCLSRPVRRGLIAGLARALADDFGNASSVHHFGQRAKALIGLAHPEFREGLLKV